MSSELFEESWRKLRQIKKEIELHEKNRKEIYEAFYRLEVEREKINKKLEKLWHEFRKLYREVV